MNVLSFAILLMPLMAHGISMKKFDDSLTYPTEHHQLMKRQAPASRGLDSTKQKDFYDFVEGKLIQHSQALEHLVKLVNEAVDALNGIAENLGKNLEEPKLPEKMNRDDAEAEPQGRSGDGDESRRSFWGLGLKLHSFSNFKPATNVWCSVAVLCHRTGKTVCGYDDSFGYGKFDDLCHLIQVNCYWNYNFGLVPNCRSPF